MTTILVIEDETLLRDEVAEWLTLEQYEVLTAEDGRRGVELAFGHQPDLVVCDITMPQMNGHEVLLSLRANEATADVPFIFITARAAHDDVRKGMELGADDYITKPFTHQELLRAVQVRLQKKATTEAQRQRAVEQWQQAFASEREQRLLKATMVAMFSHDFRTPLTTILSSAGILRSYEERLRPEQKQQQFDRISASVYRLNQMLDDMLALAEMEGGYLQFTPQPLDLTDFANAIVDEFRLMHQETHTLILTSSLSDPVLVDARLVRQLLTNLIANAVKYSPAGSDVHIDLHTAGPWVELRVNDEGIGIPKEDQARLFEPFFRASNVRNIKGTGLGLAIAKQAVDLHGGSITVESRQGTGTRFLIRLPHHLEDTGR